jgi:hypothetical protein
LAFSFTRRARVRAWKFAALVRSSEPSQRVSFIFSLRSTKQGWSERLEHLQTTVFTQLAADKSQREIASITQIVRQTIRALARRFAAE